MELLNHGYIDFSTRAYLCAELRVRNGYMSTRGISKLPFRVTVFTKTCLGIINRVLALI